MTASKLLATTSAKHLNVVTMIAKRDLICHDNVILQIFNN